jgi:hypothetical protein
MLKIFNLPPYSKAGRSLLGSCPQNIQELLITGGQLLHLQPEDAPYSYNK